MKFSVIIGNPPYQDGSKSGKVNAGGGKKNLYTKFTMMALDRLNPNGILAFIIPPGIMKSTSWGERTKEMNKIMEKNLLVAHMKDISHHFDVGTFISYFIVQNNDEYKGTRIISESEYVADVRKWGFIPLYSNDITYSIIEKMTDPSKGMPMNWKRDAKDCESSHLSMIPLQHVNLNKRGEINFAIGDKFAGKSGSLTYEIDDVDAVAAFMSSTPMKFWNMILRYNSTIYRKFINGIRVSTDLTDYSNEGIYQFYGFTKEEISYIESKTGIAVRD